MLMLIIKKYFSNNIFIFKIIILDFFNKYFKTKAIVEIHVTNLIVCLIYLLSTLNVQIVTNVK